MKIPYLLLACIATLSTIFSCNKDDTTNGVGTTPSFSDNSEKVTGSLTSTYIFITAAYPKRQGPYYEEYATASFLRSSQEIAPVLADTVLVNSIGLREVGGRHYEISSDIPLLTMNDSCNWEVRDTTYVEIPSFKFNYRTPYPSILGKIPDTISKAKLLNLDIQIAGADSVVMYFSGDTTNFESYIIKSFSPYIKGSYVFSVEDLKTIRPSARRGAKQELIIFAYKRDIHAFEGRFISFTKVYQYQTGVWVNK